MRQRTLHAKLCPALACLALAGASVPSRADVVDLSSGARRSSGRPGALVIKGEGGSAYAPFGYVGGAISYLNEAALVEIEAGAGAGLPGVQAGVSLRKLFGDLGEYFLVELSVAGNSKVSRGTNPLDPTKGTQVWTNLGIGFEHRAGLFSLGLSGGASFFSFSQTPAAYVHGGIGLAF
jgi:hypothetical protein